MDIADRAQLEQERLLQSALNRRRSSAPLPAASGRCLNCDEPLPAGERFCDADCRDDHVRLEASRLNRRIVQALR